MAFTPGPNNVHADQPRRQFRFVPSIPHMLACGRVRHSVGASGARPGRAAGVFSASRWRSMVVGAVYMLWRLEDRLRMAPAHANATPPDVFSGGSAPVGQSKGVIYRSAPSRSCQIQRAAADLDRAHCMAGNAAIDVDLVVLRVAEPVLERAQRAFYRHGTALVVASSDGLRVHGALVGRVPAP